MTEPETSAPQGFTRARTLLGAAAVAALIGTAPAALRVAATHAESLVAAWFALAALVLVPATIVQWLLRSAKPTLRALLAPAPEARMFALVLTTVITFAATAIQAAFLRRTTHHAGLAGMTYAVAAAFTLVAAFVVSMRLATAFARRSSALLQWAQRVAVIALALLIVLAASRVVRGSLGPEWGSMVVDAAMICAASLALGHAAFEENRQLAWIAPPLIAAVLLIGWRTWSTHGLLPDILRSHAPLFALLFAPLSA
jgi:hypothetical protein